jgi:hypothetical protein
LAHRREKFKVGLSVESLTPPTRLRLAAILSEVQNSISQLMTTLAHRQQQEQEEDDEKGAPVAAPARTLL